MGKQQATVPVLSAAQERHLTAARAGQRMAAAEPTAEDELAARRMLLGEATAAEVVAERFAQIDAKYGITR